MKEIFLLENQKMISINSSQKLSHHFHAVQYILET